MYGSTSVQGFNYHFGYKGAVGVKMLAKYITATTRL